MWHRTVSIFLFLPMKSWEGWCHVPSAFVRDSSEILIWKSKYWWGGWDGKKSYGSIIWEVLIAVGPSPAFHMNPVCLHAHPWFFYSKSFLLCTIGLIYLAYVMIGVILLIHACKVLLRNKRGNSSNATKWRSENNKKLRSYDSECPEFPPCSPIDFVFKGVFCYKTLWGIFFGYGLVGDNFVHSFPVVHMLLIWFFILCHL